MSSGARKKVVITGSEGFLGRHFRKALEPHYDIAGFDIALSVFHNITAKEEVFSFLEKERPDILIHLAANPDVAKSSEFPQEDLYLNTLGTINMLEACRRFPVELMVLASSAVVYGEMKDRPFSESDYPHPTTPYGIGKFAAEQYCNLYFQKYKIPTAIFRFFNIYGPGQTRKFAIPNMIARICEAKDELEMFGHENDTRDFIFVEDICNALKLCIEKKPVGHTFNVATGRETKVLEVAKIIAKLAGKPNLRFFYKSQGQASARISRVVGNANLIKEKLGWTADTPMETGLSKMMPAV